MTGDPDGTSQRSLAARRRVLKGLVGVGTLGAVGAATRLLSGQSNGGGKDGPALSLVTHESPDMGSLEVPVDDDLVRKVGDRQWRSDRLSTSSYSMVAFIWAAGSRQTPELHVRSRREAGWGPWTSVPALHGGSDRAAEEGREHTGTELIWVGASDGIQFKVAGHRPPRLSLVLLYPRRHSSDTDRSLSTGATMVRGSARLAAAGTDSMKPTILSRADWGADESWRDGPPGYNQLMQQVHIHHTASGNDYSTPDVPGLIRGMYRYHTHNLGWSDIGYNFLVDRFGRVWEGRAGGVDRPVRGAHTRGFNTTSAGIAVIGNFDQTVPGPPIIEAVAGVAAWRISGFAGRPRGSVQVRSDGSDKFRANEIVQLRVIDGHRDTNDTACPGQHLYEALPQIRRRAKAIISAAYAAEHPVLISVPARLSGTPLVGQSLTVIPGVYEPADAGLTYTWMRDGVAIPGATGTSYVCMPGDFGAELSVRIDASRPPRGTAAQTLAAPAPVSALPVLTIKTRGRAGRATVRVRVIAPVGVNVIASGEVVVRIGRHEQKVDVVDGLGIARFVAVRRGTRRVSVRYLGANGLSPASAHTSFRVT